MFWNKHKINKLGVQEKKKPPSVSCRVYCLWVPGKVTGSAWWDPVDIQSAPRSRTLTENQRSEQTPSTKATPTKASERVLTLFCVFTEDARGGSCAWTPPGRCEPGGSAGSPGCSWPEVWRPRASAGARGPAPTAAGRPPRGACCSSGWLPGAISGGGGVEGRSIKALIWGTVLLGSLDKSNPTADRLI